VSVQVRQHFRQGRFRGRRSGSSNGDTPPAKLRCQVGNWIGSRFYPAGTVASTTCRSLASAADKINLGIPLPSALADRTRGIQAAVAGLEGDDVERMRAVRSVAVNDIAGMAHDRLFVLHLRKRKPRAFGPDVLVARLD